MNLLRLLLLVVIVWLTYRLVKDKLAQRKRPLQAPRSQRTITARVVKCEQCGLHVPEQEAVLDEQQRPFCSAEHRDSFRE